MASAQQKPKCEKGTRNSSRHNGKASKQNVFLSRLDDNRAAGKAKPSGCTYRGISIKRLAEQAANTGRSLEDLKADLDNKANMRRAYHNTTSKAKRIETHEIMMARLEKPKPRSLQG